MCNVCNHFYGSGHKDYPAHFTKNLNPANAGHHECIGGCGKHLGDHEINPPGRATPRAMCEDCYQAWGEKVKETGLCGVCGEELGVPKMTKYLYNPQEVTNRLHDGLCLDYFCELSTESIKGGTGIRKQPAIAHQPMETLEFDRHTQREPVPVYRKR